MKAKTPKKTLASKAASAFGRMGGLATSKDREHMRKIGKKGSRARWSNKLKTNQ